jgi:hypothetical protein
VISRIIGGIERAAGFTREDTPTEKLNKLDAMLARNATSPHDASLLAEMLFLAFMRLDADQ